jgi:hypothetical protein
MFTEKVHLKPQCSGTYREQSAARQKLLRLMQKNPFSQIENLAVINGQPQFDPTTKIIAEHKFGANDGPRREAELADFVLKKEHIELFRQFDQIGSGVILTLEVRGGLPFRMQSEVAA